MDLSTPHSIAIRLNVLAAEFDALCVERHKEGLNKYGEFTWMENDVLRMMLEELADTVNYARMHAVKILLMQETLEAQLSPELLEDMGFNAFKGTKDTGWTK